MSTAARAPAAARASPSAARASPSAAPAPAPSSCGGVAGFLGRLGLGSSPSAAAPAAAAPGGRPSPAAALAAAAAAGRASASPSAAAVAAAAAAGRPSPHAASGGAAGGSGARSSPAAAAAAAGGVPPGTHKVEHFIEAIVAARWNGDTRQPVILDAACDLSRYSYFVRGNARDAFYIAAEAIAKRVTVGSHVILLPKEYADGKTCIVQLQDDGLCLVAFVNAEYPPRVMQMAFKTLTAAVKGAKDGAWRTTTKNFTLGVSDALEAVRREYNDPKKVDALVETAAKLSEVREAVARTMVSLLARGEKLETILAETELLTESTRRWVAATKPSPWCCVML